MGFLTFEKVNEFWYVGAILSTKNDWAKKISLRIIKTEKASFALRKFMKSKVISKKTPKQGFICQ